MELNLALKVYLHKLNKNVKDYTDNNRLAQMYYKANISINQLASAKSKTLF